MKITLFARRRTTKEGKPFFTYLARLPRKDGSEPLGVQVKFRQECGSPRGEDCPMNIIVPKECANLSTKHYGSSTVNAETGETVYFDQVTYELWVSSWTKGEEYKDTSLDDFED